MPHSILRSQIVKTVSGTKAPVEREVLIKELEASLRPVESSSQKEIRFGYWALAGAKVELVGLNFAK